MTYMPAPPPPPPSPSSLPPPETDAEFATRCFRVAAVIGALPRILDDIRHEHPEVEPRVIYSGQFSDAVIAALRCCGWPGGWRVEHGPSGNVRVYPVGTRELRHV